MCPDSYIKVAAQWLAERQWSPADDIPGRRPSDLVATRYGRWVRDLEATREKAIADDVDLMGACVTIRGSGPRDLDTATIHIKPHVVVGYVGNERKPSFIYPSVN